jgi:hypothetical protein
MPETVRDDMRQAFRSLRRTPVFAVTAMATLALGQPLAARIPPSPWLVKVFVTRVGPTSRCWDYQVA